MKRFLHLFSALCLLFALTGCTLLESSEAYVARQLSCRLPNAQCTLFADSHGGFHGDGDTLAILRFEDGAAAADRMRSAGWHNYPLPEALEAELFGRETAQGRSGGWLREKFGLYPEITDGKWYFKNRQDGAANPYAVSGLANAYSYNYTAALYNADTGILYYIEMDT